MVLDEDNEKQMILLRKKRGVVKASLTRLRNFVKEFDHNEQSISLLEFRQEELPNINKKFDAVQCEIELITEEPEKEEEERALFERNYFETRSQMQEIINTRSSSSTVGPNTSFGSSSNTNRVRLAPIPLPTFNGDIENWEAFYDVFRALVHNDEGLTSVQKLYYLRSCLSGPALDIVSSIPMVDGNYEVFTERLKQRYDNRSLVIQTHIRALLDAPRVDTATIEALQLLHSHIGSHVAALKALGQPIEQWDAWLVTIILRCLDKNTAHEWQLRQEDSQLPKYIDIERFLARRCIAFENSNSEIQSRSHSQPMATGQHQSTSKQRKSEKTTKMAFLVTGRGQTTKCPCCTGLHRIYACDKFKDLSINDRLNIIRDTHLCFNCLSAYHTTKTCKSNGSCGECGLKHNTLLHFSKSVSDDQKVSNTSEGESSATGALSATLWSSGNRYAFLATAQVIVKNTNGMQFICRAVLDSGAQVNFISKRLQNVLKLSGERVALPVSGIGSSRTQSTTRVDIKVCSRVSPFQANISCYVLPSIVNTLSSSTRPSDGWGIKENILSQLADPQFDQAGTIDMLMGAGIFFELLESERIPLQTGNLTLQSTKLGWVMTGEFNVNCLVSIGASLEDEWRTMKTDQGLFGRLSKANKRHVEEQETVRHFEKTATRRADGRFVLRLPVKPEVSQLGDSISMAMSRFISVERRLSRDEQLRTEYVNFMTQYLEMGHMEEVIENEIPTSRQFYLPHHAVVKTASLTTKVRVVFDASAKSSSGLSLNDVLMCGPSIQEELFSILCRFRSHQFVITADVEKMFRQVEVAEEDRNLQRIVWRSNPSEALRTYRLGRVAYGTTSASFMTTKCLSVLSEEFNSQFPNAAKAVRTDFYMDDLLSGAQTEEECLRLQRNITRILNSAKMPLRKWCSNSQSVLEHIDNKNDDELLVLDLGENDVIKSLGLCWKPVADVFQFNVAISDKNSEATKRSLLSALNSIFDPLGFLAPVLVKGKIFLQQLWLVKADWDSSLSVEIKQKWYNYWSDLSTLKTLEIPRKAVACAGLRTEFHGFCDASENAYGACIYVRCKLPSGVWQSRLLCASTRVAPLKGATIPRLELGGALVLAQLAMKVAKSWKVDIHKFYLWTDSTIVLGWLNSQSSRLKTYVSNRVAQILDITNTEKWYYVRTYDNPADVLSRGVKAQDLKGIELWWSGPKWLSHEQNGWRFERVSLPTGEELPEQKTVRFVLLTVPLPMRLVDSCSNWQRLRRATAWILRFIEFIKTKRTPQLVRYLTVKELMVAEQRLITYAQREAFPEEHEALAKNKDIPGRSKLRSLNIGLRYGMIVVGGRLDNANLSQDQRQPIILPYNHRITQLIFLDYHMKLLHCGPQLLLAEIRQRYWPLSGRLLARSTVRRCVKCVRSKPTFQIPIMAPLPKERVQCSRPFTYTGVDFAGPLIIRSGIRGRSGTKAWVSIFVCFSTRAVHIEAVEDLTSKAFIAALRRFVARRGKPAELWSDNGTNFVGANKELTKYTQHLGSQLANEGITWRFNPPSAPHFGGLWEAAVKSAKHHLARTTGEAKLTLSELSTLLCQIEACLNSRPLTPMSSDPNDFTSLTPAHFLLGAPVTSFPEPDLNGEEPHAMRRWKFVQHLLQTFWKRWHMEYLPQLQVRGKWTSGSSNLAIDDLVIVKEDNLPPFKWHLARVIELHLGCDGNVRVVSVRNSSGKTMRRPVAKLCKLPIDAEEAVEK
ncbi:uncharacterized protein LOC132938783 [Metopolophium dirhodum]|uniref:uncharacterized protein LOC132938783 n=1 Tax=Metopolophium dirhodum TaxID=44670 RepID=UPI00298F79F9|nr:uncharacterized protein LOC132938783 [Metopolophium dirhodum]